MRELQLRSSAEVLAELDRLEAGAASVEGPWSLGQTLAHCAQSIEYSMDGYPTARSALFRGTIGRLAMRVFLWRGRLSHDIAAAIPGAPALDGVSDAEGFARLRSAIRRFSEFGGALAPHFAYGRVTKADYEALHAMHTADHLRRIRT